MGSQRVPVRNSTMETCRKKLKVSPARTATTPTVTNVLVAAQAKRSHAMTCSLTFRRFPKVSMGLAVVAADLSSVNLAAPFESRSARSAGASRTFWSCASYSAAGRPWYPVEGTSMPACVSMNSVKASTSGRCRTLSFTYMKSGRASGA
jgi:hypothetical protein